MCLNILVEINVRKPYALTTHLMPFLSMREPTNYQPAQAPSTVVSTTSPCFDPTTPPLGSGRKNCCIKALREATEAQESSVPISTITVPP